MDNPSPERIAFLGGFLPRLCGIATFTHDLCEAVAAAAPAADCFTGAMNDRPERYDYPPRVRFELDQKDIDSYRRAADFLNFSNAQVLCVQHEFGIYGGPAGSHLLTLLREVRIPVITTLHTVLGQPDAIHRTVMEELVGRSNRLVVMARKGAEILTETYGVPEGKIDLIPHGIPDMPFMESSFYKQQFGVAGRPVLLTFGLLGPGKGIEFAIAALPEIIRHHPDVVYLVLGATHPHLVAQEGENYRLGLERLAGDLGVKDHVIFYNRFVSLDDLKEFIGASDIYLTPYLNEAQITSGTLAYVFGAGKAVVSTPYWHAQELLAEDRGILVPFRDPAAIARGVCAFLDEPARLQATREKAYLLGREMIWPKVAGLYLEAFEQARRDCRVAPRSAFAQWTLATRPYDKPPLRLDHLLRMTDGTGIFQHALFNVPNYQEGYCTDDNSRAYLLCILLDELGGQPASEGIDQLATRYLAFLASALNPETGRFRNFMSHGRVWLETAGSEDSHARAVWALGSGAGRSRNPGHRQLCWRLFGDCLAVVEGFRSPRAWAFALLGIHALRSSGQELPAAKALQRDLVRRLLAMWKGCATETWPWFETIASYDNARISQALLLTGLALDDPEALAVGLKSLSWLASVQRSPKGHFCPIGSNGFYPMDGARAHFDQQPLEAQAMVSACLSAFQATQDAAWSSEAKRAFEWFLGRNDLGVALYDSSTGGCRDALHDDRVNENQGAESTLAFHLSLAEMSVAEHGVIPVLKGAP
jgi:glycosyltransferase involved in cell wall biosynthesis